MSSEARSAILNAAGEVFTRFGFKKAAMEDIARLAGVGKGSIYLHFDSKEALFEACLRRDIVERVAELEAAIRRAKTPEAQVRAFISCKLEQLTRQVHGQRLRIETLLEMHSHALRLLPEHQRMEEALLARILIEGNTQGAFAVTDPHQVAVGLVESLAGLSIKGLTQGFDAHGRAALDAYFDVFIRGLAPAGTTPRRKS
ncbi:TetR/AcrR family transcriptional regulator [Archangium violaceum]|uniref:TetR/AcrR family transcriptional regulator n=1 Tax=Archangium violaceum TaxID=83451 RepID=UPI0019503524|nr:TetR/AcrR family transcriptional regulator [Archangium violaceum]QRN93537.1 TetR/AcrR family transcriptional regulator [Archangium violaceum]